MRIVFMGTPAFVLPVLDSLLQAGHDIAAVYTRPDSPAGRGQRTVSPPVKDFAVGKGLPVVQPESLRRRPALDEMRALAPEAIVVAAYGRILPPEALAIPLRGVLNIHPSLLPKYRGPSPVATAILDGCETTGVTVMLLDEGMDTGPLLAQQEAAILPDEGAGALTARLFVLGAELLVQTLPRWTQGELFPRPQDNAQATVTKLYAKEDGELDWAKPASYLARMLRAFDPWPGCSTRWDGKLLKVVAAVTLDAALPAGAAPGAVLTRSPDGRETLCVATGEGLLRLDRVQLEGKRPQEAAEFLRGYPRFAGARLPS
ncbi:MAG: methionyl-tRNA formyltransferase [Chloroflexi bacterium]|nr:methionyl-tRNA formyltransferase [Chloroflexota bacterium]